MNDYYNSQDECKRIMVNPLVIFYTQVFKMNLTRGLTH